MLECFVIFLQGSLTRLVSISFVSCLVSRILTKSNIYVLRAEIIEKTNTFLNEPLEKFFSFKLVGKF